MRNWLIASANVVASEGGIAFLLPRSLGNSSTTIALHPSIASRNVMNIARRPRPRGTGGVGINTNAGNRQEDRPGGTRKAGPVPSARKAVGIGSCGTHAACQRAQQPRRAARCRLDAHDLLSSSAMPVTDVIIASDDPCSRPLSCGWTRLGGGPLAAFASRL
jgi:hypothetical protein